MADESVWRPLAAERVDRGAPFTVTVNRREVTAYEGESVLGVLWAIGCSALRRSRRRNEPRGFYCGMGACFDCLVEIDEQINVRACLEPARPGMSIRVPQGSPPWTEDAGAGRE